MAFEPKIPVAAEYAQAVGYATYAFTYLEWVVIWTCEKLAPGLLNRHALMSAGQISNAFDETTARPNVLPQEVADALKREAKQFKILKDRRNDLLHAHPYTAEGGEQRLKRGNVDWTIAEIENFASDIEACSIATNDIFHAHLYKK